MSWLLAFDDEMPLAHGVAQALGWPLHEVQRHRFPDGETRLRLPPRLPQRVALLRGLQQPNAKLTELLLVLVIFSGLPLVSMQGEHVVFDSLDPLLPPWLRRAQQLVVDGLCAAALLGGGG